MPKQLEVFQRIDGTVDFVTITIGGNDVDFAKVIETCALKSTYLGSKDLELQLSAIWKKYYAAIKEKIRQTYKDIRDAAPEAKIIVAGYPQLLDPAEPAIVSIISRNDRPQSGIHRQFGFQEETNCLHAVSPAENVRVYTVKDATENQGELKYLTVYCNHISSSDLVYLKDLPSGAHYEVE